MRWAWAALGLVLFSAGVDAQLLSNPSGAGSIVNGKNGLLTYPPNAGGMPGWVSNPYPGSTLGDYCDFTRGAGGECWSPSAGVHAATSDLTLTRALQETYTNASGAISYASSGTLAEGSAGLQIVNNQNLLKQSSTFSNASWNKIGATIAAPTITCAGTITGPDGVATDGCSMSFPANSTVAQYSLLSQTFTTVTNASYDCSIYLQGTASDPNNLLQMMSLDNGGTYTKNKIVTSVPNTGWTRYDITFVALSTTTFFDVGTNTQVTGPMRATGNDPATPAVTMNIAWAQCNPGTEPTPYVATVASAATSVVDNISAKGGLATALASSGGAVVVTTNGAQQNTAGYSSTPISPGTILSEGSTVILGQGATTATMNSAVTGLTTALASTTTTRWDQPETVTFAWGASGGTINLNGASTTDAVSRTTSGTFYLGSINGASALWNGYIKTLAVYTTPVTPTVSSPPISGVTMMQLSVNTFVYWYNNHYAVDWGNGDSWDITEAGNGNLYSQGADQSAWTVASTLTGNPQTAGFNTVTAADDTGIWSFPSGGQDLSLTLGQTSYFYNSQNWKPAGMVSAHGNLYMDIFQVNAATQSGTPPWAPTAFSNSFINSPLASPPSCSSTGSNCGASFDGLSGISHTPGGSLPSPTWAGNFSTTTPVVVQTVSIVQYLNDESPSATYNGGTNLCTGGVASGCPDNSGNYLYATALDPTWRYFYLGRIAYTGTGGIDTNPDNIETATNWQWYSSTNTGCDQNIATANCWVAGTSTSIGTATPILDTGSTRGTNNAMPFQYIPRTGRYVWFQLTYTYLQEGLGSTFSTYQTWTPYSVWTMWEAPHLNSGWHKTGWAFSTGPFGFYGPTVSAPSLITDGGVTGWMTFDGNFGANGNQLGFYTPTWAHVQFNN